MVDTVIVVFTKAHCVCGGQGDRYLRMHAARQYIQWAYSPPAQRLGGVGSGVQMPRAMVTFIVVSGNDMKVFLGRNLGKVRI